MKARDVYSWATPILLLKARVVEFLILLLQLLALHSCETRTRTSHSCD